MLAATLASDRSKWRPRATSIRLALALAVGVALLVANRLIPGPETVAIVVYFVAVAMTARAMTATRATTTPLEIPIVYAAAPSSLPITA
jgi:hypothetical protein